MLCKILEQWSLTWDESKIAGKWKFKTFLMNIRNLISIRKINKKLFSCLLLWNWAVFCNSIFRYENNRKKESNYSFSCHSFKVNFYQWWFLTWKAFLSDIFLQNNCHTVRNFLDNISLLVNEQKKRIIKEIPTRGQRPPAREDF